MKSAKGQKPTVCNRDIYPWDQAYKGLKLFLKKSSPWPNLVTFLIPQVLFINPVQ